MAEDETAVQAPVAPAATQTAPVPVAKVNPATRRPWTDEERQRQSVLAKQLVAQGKFGGQHNGRRSKKPAYAVVAATAAANGKKLADELLDIALHAGAPKLRMDAIKLLLDIEHKSQQEVRAQEEHLLKLSRNELIARFFNQLQELTGLDFEGFEALDTGDKPELPPDGEDDYVDSDAVEEGEEVDDDASSEEDGEEAGYTGQEAFIQ